MSFLSPSESGQERLSICYHKHISGTYLQTFVSIMRPQRAAICASGACSWPRRVENKLFTLSDSWPKSNQKVGRSSSVPAKVHSLAPATHKSESLSARGAEQTVFWERSKTIAEPFSRCSKREDVLFHLHENIFAAAASRKFQHYSLARAKILSQI